MITKKRTLILLVLLAGAVLLGGCGGDSNSGDDTMLAIGTAGIQGIYYPIGAGIAEVINKYVPDVNASAEVTAGGVENVTRIDKGEIELGLVNYDAAYFAANGEEPFDTEMNVSALIPTIASTTQIVTLQESGITSLLDLKGKKVAVGPAGSSINIMALNLLDAAGIDPDKDVKSSALSNVEAAQALKDGHIDAMILMTTYPMASITEVASGDKIRILPVPEDVKNKLLNDYPYYVESVIPANVYDNVDYEVETISLMTMLIGSNSLDEELVYEVVKTVFENIDELKEIHSNMENMSVEDAKDIPIRIHPGAEKYYRECGVL